MEHMTAGNRAGRSRPTWPFLVLLTCLLLTHLFLAPVTAAAKSYQISRVDIAGKLYDNGSMEVTEARTYTFRGSFRFAYRTTPKDDSANFVDFRVTEEGQAYRQEDTEAPGTFRVTETGDDYEVRWFFRAKNESRTFSLHYRVTGLVRRYEDAAVLYHQFIGDEFDKPSREVRVTVTPPLPVAQDRINAWLHGPLWAEYSLAADGTFEAWCEQLPPHTFLEINALYPTELFPRAAARKGVVRETIMAEEARWVAEANQNREAASRESRTGGHDAVGNHLMPALGLLGIAGWFLLYRSYGRRRSAPPVMEQSPAVPDETPPALVGYLLHSRQVSPQAMVATLMDLARRGYLLLEEETREEEGWFGHTRTKTHYTWRLKRDHFDIFAEGLLAYENMLIRFLFDDLAEGEDTLDMDSFQDHRRQFVSFFREWKKEVQAEAKKRGYYDPRSLRGQKYSLALGLGMMAVAFPLVLVYGFWSFFLAAAGFVVLMLSFVIPRRTRAGEVKARRWQAFKTYLKKHRYRLEKQPGWVEYLESVFIYGVIFRLSEKVYQELMEFLPETPARAPMTWYICHGTDSGGFNPATFTASFSAMVAVANSSVSSASGTGGGATGGGGGGAGGGGGGAG